MSASLSAILGALADATGHTPRQSGRNWQARCPAHDDQVPSLSVGESPSGRLLLHCHAGCKYHQILDALRPHLPDSADKPSRPFATAAQAVAWLESHRGPRTAWWQWQNLQGDPVAINVRFDGAGGRTFCPAIRTPRGWTIGALPAPRPLYRLPDLAASGEPVYVVEGEKCAEALVAIRLNATTSFGGSGGAKLSDWTPLAGRNVVILPDRDPPGSRYAADVVLLLLALQPAALVKVVELPGLPQAGDIVDFLAARDSRTLEELRGEIEGLAAAAKLLTSPLPERRPVVKRFHEIRSQTMRWLWPKRIPLGKLTLVAGDPGLGKSLLVLDIAARLSRGAAWPDAPFGDVMTGATVLLSAEDDPADTIHPRLAAANADLGRVILLEAVQRHDEIAKPFSLAEDLPALEAAVRGAGDVRLVIIDPISAYLPAGAGFDSHRNTDVRAMLAPLSKLAAELGVAVIGVTHLRKGEGAAIYRIIGSLAFAAAARAVWGVTRDKLDHGRRLFLPIKTNLSGQRTGLAFSLYSAHNDAPCLAWEPEAVDLPTGGGL